MADDVRRRFHAETIDLVVCAAVAPLVTADSFQNWNEVYSAACAFGNMALAQAEDRLEDWAGLFDG